MTFCLLARLAGKRTLITGGTSGIGLETAWQFLAEGARVIVTGVNPGSVAKAKAALGEQVLCCARTRQASPRSKIWHKR